MSSNPFFFDSFVVGNKDELAIFMEDSGKESVYNFKNPHVRDVTIEEQRDFSVGHTMGGEELRLPQSKRIKATITIETVEWEAVWGEDVRDELPDTVKNMSVEELLHAVNQKISDNQ
jgi:hypothetical protein